jgi:hypothetical protein
MRSDLDVLLERGEVGEHHDVLEAYRTKIRPGARGCGEWECRAASFFWRAMEPSRVADLLLLRKGDPLPQKNMLIRTLAPFRRGLPLIPFRPRRGGGLHGRRRRY